MTLVRKTQLSTAQGIWSHSDQEYFRKHKSAQFYVRDLRQGESENFRIMGDLYDALESKALSDMSLPTNVHMRVIVLQIRPGERVRLPVLDWLGRDKDIVLMIRPDGSLVEMRVSTLLAELRAKRAAENWRNAEPSHDPMGDYCNVCSRRLLITQVMTQIRVGDKALSACSACVVANKLPEGARMVGMGMYVTEADAADPRMQSKILTMLQSLRERLGMPPADKN